MTVDQSVFDQVRIFLSSLPLRLRARLIREIEDVRARDDDTFYPIIIELLRDVTRDEVETAKREGRPQPLFCEPLEPFLVDERGQTKHRGFIRRQSLYAVWRWLCREGAIADALSQADDAATEALLAGDDARASEILAGMRRDCVPVIEKALRDAATDQRLLMHLTTLVEGGRNLDDMPDIAAVFRMENRLTKLAAKLPPSIDNLDADLTVTIIKRLKNNGTDVVYPLSLVYHRLDSPVQIIRLLTQYEGTDDGARLSRSRFSECVAIVLADMDFAAERIVQRAGKPQEFDELLVAIRQFYSLANGVNAAVDVKGAAEWRNRLAALRRRASEALSAEVERIPGAVRRVVRSNRRDGGRGGPAQEDDILEAEYAVRLMTALGPYREELAVNELLATVVGQIENYIEAVNGAILEDMRDAIGLERVTAERDLEVALRINKIVFGENFAALLKRSAENAALQLGDDDDDDDDDEEEPAVKQVSAA